MKNDPQPPAPTPPEPAVKIHAYTTIADIRIVGISESDFEALSAKANQHTAALASQAALHAAEVAELRKQIELDSGNIERMQAAGARLEAEAAALRADKEALDFIESQVGRIEALEPYSSGKLWRWVIFLKNKDHTLSMNNLRAAIDAARTNSP